MHLQQGIAQYAFTTFTTRFCMICIYNKILREHYIQFVLSSSPEPKTSRESCDDGDNIVAGGDVIHELLSLHWKWSGCSLGNDIYQISRWWGIFCHWWESEDAHEGCLKENFCREWRVPERKTFGDNEGFLKNTIARGMTDPILVSWQWSPKIKDEKIAFEIGLYTYSHRSL